MEIWVYKYRAGAEEKAAQTQLALQTEQEHYSDSYGTHCYWTSKLL